MTGRGGKKEPVLLPPRDPSLETRPVPQERHFAVQAFGPGADVETHRQFQSIEAVEQQLPDASSIRNSGDVESDAKELFKALTQESELVDLDWTEDGETDGEPTWGPVVIVTAYSDKVTPNISQAINNLVETIHRYILRCRRSRAFATEAFKRLEIKVIKDKELLENASDDRVREEFNAYVRSLRLFPPDMEWERESQKFFKDNLNRPRGPRRYDFCVVLDEQTIDSLASITFPEDLDDDSETLRHISVKLVDRKWRYPKEAGASTQGRHYTGTDICPLVDLPLICAHIYNYADLEEMFPLDCYRDMH
ncbi:uncharacterized protein FIESC28_11422 [Fusarium coffeatum]|uniref:Uncharacterized protein n=1 Tax=Fusarium coffeatum TaxID=231269 RepID=A0A366QM38_9HYPO|nr:uncharacterized protein FIESC28_11422 [Fusarium coffeatum]RBR05065.1 hypothetical protein FIESC28_11422 [Fusarium coffeatum]